MKVVIESYLTEAKLAVAIAQLVGDAWAGGQVKLPGSRRRFDMAFLDHSTKVLVEYDGDEHYRDSMKIKADRQKDKLATENGMRLVRIPYWVQLDQTMARHWFGLEADIEQSFPHGFITTKLFPASFCELGIARFRRELNSLPTTVRDAVVASLRERIAEHGVEYVLPADLREIA
ncbi:MAG: hypothetical protein ACJ8FY_13800 [Gemmataceae bacterium]